MLLCLDFSPGPLGGPGGSGGDLEEEVGSGEGGGWLLASGGRDGLIHVYDAKVRRSGAGGKGRSGVWSVREAWRGGLGLGWLLIASVC